MNLIHLELEVTPEQLTKITRILNPSPQAKWNARNRHKTKPKAKPAPAPAPTPPVPAERASYFIEFTTINKKRRVHKLDGTEADLAEALARNKGRQPTVLAGPLSSTRAGMWFLENKPTQDDSNSWRF